MDKEGEYAILSKLAYDAETSLKDPHFKKTYDKYHMEGRYDIDKELSSANHVTFVDKETGRAVISFRGTRPTNIADIFSDVGIALGLQAFTPRFEEASEVTKRAIKKYGGKDNVDVTGHSLGGAQALYVNNKFGVEAHAYNPGEGIPPAMLSSINPVLGAAAKAAQANRHQSEDNAHVYLSGLDPISVLANRLPVDVNHQRNDQGFLGDHNLENFIPPPPKKPRVERDELGQETGEKTAPEGQVQKTDPTEEQQNPLHPPVFIDDGNYHPNQMRNYRSFIPNQRRSGGASFLDSIPEETDTSVLAPRGPNPDVNLRPPGQAIREPTGMVGRRPVLTYNDLYKESLRMAEEEEEGRQDQTQQDAQSLTRTGGDVVSRGGAEQPRATTQRGPQRRHEEEEEEPTEEQAPDSRATQSQREQSLDQQRRRGRRSEGQDEEMGRDRGSRPPENQSRAAERLRAPRQRMGQPMERTTFPGGADTGALGGTEDPFRS